MCLFEFQWSDPWVETSSTCLLFMATEHDHKLLNFSGIITVKLLCVYIMYAEAPRVILRRTSPLNIHKDTRRCSCSDKLKTSASWWQKASGTCTNLDRSFSKLLLLSKSIYVRLQSMLHNCSTSSLHVAWRLWLQCRTCESEIADPVDCLSHTFISGYFGELT